MAFTYGTVFATSVPLNAVNMAKCLLGYGPYADFPAPAPYVSPSNPGNVGMMAYATNTNQLYYSNGTSWVCLSQVVTMADMVASRALNSTYQNTSGKNMSVNVSVHSSWEGAGGKGLLCLVGDSVETLGYVVFELIQGVTFAAGGDWQRTGSFLVPPGYYYKAQGINATLLGWTEWLW